MGSATNSAPPPSARPTVLIVDDTSQDVALLAEYLRGTRWRLVVAFDGHEGYQKATVIQPDIILMDLRMPRTDGFAACRLLKADARTRHIPVLFLSGSNELDDRLQGFELGAVDYISKPFAPEEVLARIRLHLQLARQNGANQDAPAAPQEEVSAAMPANGVVAAAMQLLLQDISTPPTLLDLSHKVGTNERRLTELFREVTGLPVFAWLREQRLALACRLLEESDLDIQHISDHVGYGSAGNFTTMFRERLGVTPRDYRAAKRKASSPE